MTEQDITVVRIYLSEAEHRLKPLLACLRDESKVAGVTVFRGISGFGQSGKMHSADLLDLSLDLPLAVEFFDRPEKIAALLPRLHDFAKPGHLLYWPAKAVF